jgi:hypothetical protein
MRSKNKKWIIVGSLLFICLVVAGVSILLSRNSDSKNTAPPGIAGTSEINYDPPTEEERSAGDAQKDQNIKQQQLDQQQTPSSNATVIITDASYYADDNTVEVRAYVSNILEDGGTCTAQFTQDGKTITKSSQAFKDATTTQCGALNIARSEFPNSGSWNMQLTYTSKTASGTQTSIVKL